MSEDTVVGYVEEWRGQRWGVGSERIYNMDLWRGLSVEWFCASLWRSVSCWRLAERWVLEPVPVAFMESRSDPLRATVRSCRSEIDLSHGSLAAFVDGSGQAGCPAQSRYIDTVAAAWTNKPCEHVAPPLPRYSDMARDKHGKKRKTTTSRSLVPDHHE